MLSTSLDSAYLKDELLQLKNPHIHKQIKLQYTSTHVLGDVTGLVITVVTKTRHMYQRAL